MGFLKGSMRARPLLGQSDGIRNGNLCIQKMRSVKPFRVDATAQIHVDIVKGPSNSRCMYAATRIAAPLEAVYRALAGYDSLQTFIPGLAENKCVERRDRGAMLLQVGTTNLGLGINFTARCLLDVNEWRGGIPRQLCIEDEGGFPVPHRLANGVGEVSDISFELIEGDFQVFKGLWRMQEVKSLNGGNGGGRRDTQLSYSLRVRPPPWVPVGLLESRIGKEVRANLHAVAAYVEKNQDTLAAMCTNDSLEI